MSRIILTTGCFDLFHVGHLRLLQASKWLDNRFNYLVVGINADETVRKLKGEERPIIPLNERIEIIKSFCFVNEVVVFHEPTPIELIKAIKPHVFVKGRGYNRDNMPEFKMVESYGGQVFLFDDSTNQSTSNIVRKIKNDSIIPATVPPTVQKPCITIVDDRFHRRSIL